MDARHREATVNFTLSIALAIALVLLALPRIRSRRISHLGFISPTPCDTPRLPFRGASRVCVSWIRAALRLRDPLLALLFVCWAICILWILAAITSLVADGDLDLVRSAWLYSDREIFGEALAFGGSGMSSKCERWSSGPANCKFMRSASGRRRSTSSSFFLKPISSSFPTVPIFLFPRSFGQAFQMIISACFDTSASFCTRSNSCPSMSQINVKGVDVPLPKDISENDGIHSTNRNHCFCIVNLTACQRRGKT